MTVILQFDRPVPEQLFFDQERPCQNDPALLAETTRLWEEAGLALHGWTPAEGDGVAALRLLSSLSSLRDALSTM